MKPRIIDNDETPEFYFQEGCYIKELSNSHNDPLLSIAQARVLPGMTTRLHRLDDTIERYLIIRGKGRVSLCGIKEKDVRENDVVIIPENCSQKITNTGPQDLVFLAICTPQFKLENYQDCE